jgi:thiamine kinase-like enzyme
MEQVYAIVSELAAQLGDPLGPAQPLGAADGGRNYRVRMTTGEYVVRLPRKGSSLLGTSREAERLANGMAASLGIAPDVAAAGPDWLVTRFLDRRPIDPERLGADPEPVARALRSFHQSGLELQSRFWVPDQLDRYAEIVRERGGALPDAYADAQAVIARIADALPLSDPVPSHNHPLPGSVLDLTPVADGEPAHIALVDWDFAAMGHHLYDLASLAVYNHFDESAQERLLAAYLGEPPGERRVAAIRLMRLMVHGHEAAWAMVGGVIPGPRPASETRASEHFEQLLRVAGDARFEDWLSSAGG